MGVRVLGIRVGVWVGRIKVVIRFRVWLGLELWLKLGLGLVLGLGKEKLQQPALKNTE